MNKSDNLKWIAIFNSLEFIFDYWDSHFIASKSVVSTHSMLLKILQKSVLANILFNILVLFIYSAYFIIINVLISLYLFNYIIFLVF